MALLAAACGGGGATGDAGADTDGPTPAQEGDTGGEEPTAAGGDFELRVGTVLPFTGDLSDFGPSLDAAVQLAVDVINETLAAEGIEGPGITLVASEDGQTAAAAGVEAATKLVQQDDVDVVIGEMASNVTIPIAESVTVPNEVVQITPTSTAPEITELDDDGYVFRILSSDVFQGVALAEAIGEEFGTDATINVGARNDAFGVALRDLFEQRWTEAGGTIGESLLWNPDAATLDSEAQALASGEPDGWLIIDFPETFARLGPSLVRSGSWDPTRTFVTEALRNEEALDGIGAEPLEGLRGTAPTSEEAPGRAAFDELFEERHGDLPLTGFEGSSFDATMLSFLAAVRAGSSDPSAVRDNLQAVSGPPGTKHTFEELGAAVTALLDGEDVDYEGAWGPIDFDENGDPGSAIYEVWEYTGGDIAQVRTFEFSN